MSDEPIRIKDAVIFCIDNAEVADLSKAEIALLRSIEALLPAIDPTPLQHAKLSAIYKKTRAAVLAKG